MLRDALDDTKARLHHVHLPKLDAADIVEYDPGDNVVAPDTFLVMAIEFVRLSEMTDAEPGGRNVR